MKFIALIFLLLVSSAAHAETLTITMGKTTRSMTTAELLKHAKAREITVKNDVSYHKTMKYRAVPVASLLEGMEIPAGASIEVVATDGFVAILPLDLLLHADAKASEAFLAIEPADKKWPVLEGKKVSAGPFYIVWPQPEKSAVRSEQWPYMIASLRSAGAPAQRWKELAVDQALPADSPIRAGQALYVTQCMSCHKMNGAGSSELGPDLNLPANPTEYFKPDALKKYIRNPASLRHWQGMQMQGFDKSALSDQEIDLIIAYLDHMAGRKKP